MVEGLRNAARNRVAARTNLSTAAQTANADQAAVADDDFTPASRMDHVRQTSPEYYREYRLKLLARLLQRNVPLDQIAEQFGVSVRQVQRDRKELHEKLRREAANLNINELIGTTMSYYDEVSGVALRIATHNKTPIPAKLAAIRTSVHAKKEQTAFLEAAGVFDVIRYRAGEEGGNSQLETLVRLAENVIAGIEDDLPVEQMEEEDQISMRLLG